LHYCSVVIAHVAILFCNDMYCRYCKYLFVRHYIIIIEEAVVSYVCEANLLGLWPPERQLLLRPGDCQKPQWVAMLLVGRTSCWLGPRNENYISELSTNYKWHMYENNSI